MKYFIPAAVLAGAILLNACGDGKADAAKQIAAVADSIKAANTIDLAEHHLPLTVEVPVGLPTATVLWKDEVGKLTVTAGDQFALEIFEGPSGLGGLKADLDRDLLKKNTVVEESPDLIIYRSEFPDDTALVFHHFSQTITVGDRTFQVSDLETGTSYSLEAIRRMAASVRVRQPA
ncbi:MAG: hypothetical protein M9900_11375 [Flavobacteriales bacterium]|nr:hypothetical protein [Flavobacteriales bacterium]